MSLSSEKGKVLALFPLFLVLIIDAMGFGIVFPLMGPLFLVPGQGLLSADTALNIRELFYGLSITCFFVCILIGSPFVGDLSDKIGRKKTVLLCLCGVGSAYMLCVIAIYLKSVILFLIGRCMAGFLAGSQSIAQAAIVDISTPESKTKNLALMTLASCIGFAIGPLVGGLFSSNQYFTWVNATTPFCIAAGLAFCNVLGLFFLFQETHIIKVKAKIKLTKIFNTLQEAWEDRNIRKVSFLFLMMQLGWGIFYQFMSYYLVQTMNYDGLKIGFFNAIIGLIFSITLVFVIRILLKILSVVMLTIVTLASQGIFTFLYAIFPQEIGIWLLLVPVTLSVGLSYTCLLTLYSESTSSERQGWVMGVSESVMSIAWIIGSLFTANISYFPKGSIFCIAGILPLFALLAVKSIRNNQAQESATSI